MSDLRNHLFATIEALRDDDKPMEVDRARAVGEVAGVLLESAKLELKLMEAVGSEASGSEFFEGVTLLPANERKPRALFAGGAR